MKALIALALSASALSFAVPAASQPPRIVPGASAVQPGHDLREQLDALDRRITDGIRTGEINRGESDRASRELGSIRGEMERLRAQGGGRLSEMDRGRLQERIDNLSRSIHWMRGHGPIVGPPVAGGDWSLERRESWLQERIDRGRADGSLSRREASRAQMGLNDIKADQAHMLRRSGRLRDSERAQLQDRLERLSSAIRWLRQNDENAPPWRR